LWHIETDTRGWRSFSQVSLLMHFERCSLKNGKTQIPNGFFQVMSTYAILFSVENMGSNSDWKFRT